MVFSSGGGMGSVAEMGARFEELGTRKSRIQVSGKAEFRSLRLQNSEVIVVATAFAKYRTRTIRCAN